MTANKGRNNKTRENEIIDYIDADMPGNPDDISQENLIKADTAMECTTVQNSATRIQGINNLSQQFSTTVMPNYIEKHMESLLYLASKLSKKSSEEGIALARLIANISIQTGEVIEKLVIDQMKEMRQVIRYSTECEFQEYCATALAVITRMSCAIPEVAAENLAACASAFRDNVANNQNGAFIAAAITAWCLLIEDCDHKTVTKALELQPVLYQLLRSPVLEVRLSAGEAIAFLHEYVLENRPSFKFENHGDVVHALSEMRGLLGKQMSKKAKRLQRTSMGQVYEFVSGGSAPVEIEVRFGVKYLTLKSFAMKMFYDCCCDVMNGGIDIHLMLNDTFRMAFELKTAPIKCAPVWEEKCEKMKYFGTTEKARSRQRKRERWNRQYDIYYDYMDY